MLYIVTALKSEAQAFVDKYKLKKSKLSNFTVFSNADMMLIISGIGVENSAHATQTFINHYDITDDDIYLNIGICGASKQYEIGALIELGTIVYNTKSISLTNNSNEILTCLDEVAYEDNFEIVDMESFGFYDAVIHSPAIKNFHILKVVSDHFEPDKVTKDATKSLIFNAIDAINLILYSKADS
ncbi:hypothetical protein N9X61_02685 [Sulfurimonas sp.]|nr:hypothetical protein [Sulfurimonas sp.]